MFNDQVLYFANDPALKALAPYSTLAHWRCEGAGPAFIKVGRRVAYSGKDLNFWLQQRRVQPLEQRAAERDDHAPGA